jgi:hypothetical protein
LALRETRLGSVSGDIGLPSLTFMTLDDFIDNLTKKQAEFIKELRCGIPSHSWRRIAHIVGDKYGIEHCTFEHDLAGERVIDGIQMVGQELCQVAADYLGEESSEAPWN